jgi:hypothetical protein
VSGIPYAKDFGGLQEVRDKVPLRRFLESVASEAEDGGTGLGLWNSSNAHGEKLYAFEAHIERKLPAILDDLNIPPFLLPTAPGNAQTHYWEFFAGPALSGAPLHYHNDAFNVLVHGEKRWALLPPSRTARSNMHPGHWVGKDGRGEALREGGTMGGTRRKGGKAWSWGQEGSWPLECVQQEGDLLYVPLHWGHATLNVRDSIGIAAEFSTSYRPFSITSNGLVAAAAAAAASAASG